MALDQATLSAVRSTRELIEAWSEAARKAALEARKRHGHAGIVGVVKSGEHPPTRIAHALDARDVRKTIEHIEKHEDRKDPKVRKLHAALKNRMAPAPRAMPDMQTHLANVVQDFRKKRHPLYDGSTRHGGPKLKINTKRKALAHAAVEEVLGANWQTLREAGFAELLHPRDRRGKFRDTLHVPTSTNHHRPLRTGEFPLGNNLPEPRSGITPDRVNNRRGRISRALADSDLSHGGVAHPGLASPGVRTHYEAEGDMGRKRNVKAMGDKKLRHLLVHPQTDPDLRERVRAEIVSRGGEAGAITAATSRRAAAPRRRTARKPPPPAGAPSRADLEARLPGGGADAHAHTSDNDGEAVRHWRSRVRDRGVVEPMNAGDVRRAFNGSRGEQKLYYRTTALPYGDMRERAHVQDAIEAIGEYNDFDPEIVIDRLDEHAGDIAEVAIAREGSAALYLRPSHKGAAERLVKAFNQSDDRRRSGADEATVEPTGWVRLWWD